MTSLCGYTPGTPVSYWGGGFYVASREGDAAANERFIMQRAFGEASRALTTEAKWRVSHPHPRMPRVVAMGSIAADANEQENSLIIYEGVTAVPIERAMGVHSIPIVLTWALELVEVMRHHAACAPETPVLRPNFADLLVTRDGSLLVLTVPAIARVWQTTWLRHSRLNPELWVPKADEGGMGQRVGVGVVHPDIFAAGAFVRVMLRERDGEPRHDITARIQQMVTRARKPTEEARFESLDELAHELRACLAGFPALEAAERAAAVHNIWTA